MDTVLLASRLVQIASPSGDWPAQQHVMGTTLAAISQAAPSGSLTLTRSSEGEQPWALLEVAGTTAPRLLFACHVDTVPVPSPDTWTVPPHAGTVADGTLLGRGAVDMKGGLAAAAHAFVHGARTGAPVALLLTSDEEIGCRGASAAADALREVPVGAIVVPEATENVVVLGHRGAWWVRVSVGGRAAHGSTPHLGSNAALAMARLVDRASRELPLRTDGTLGPETWNLGEVHAGSAPNVVPDLATASVDHRVHGPVDALARWWGGQPEVAGLTPVLDLPSLATPADDPWVAGLPAPTSPAAAPYFTDGAVLAAVLPGVPVVVWGPGAQRHMHADDEVLDLGQLEDAVRLFRAVVDAWGGSPRR